MSAQPTEASATLHVFDDVQWVHPGGETGASEDMRRGVRHKKLVWGDSGFYVKVTEMRPNHVIRPHRHTVDEVIIVLEGSIELTAGAALGPLDAVAIDRHHTYGFTVGADGVRFMVVRGGEAMTEVAP